MSTLGVTRSSFLKIVLGIVASPVPRTCQKPPPRSYYPHPPIVYRKKERRKKSLFCYVALFFPPPTSFCVYVVGALRNKMVMGWDVCDVM